MPKSGAVPSILERITFDSGESWREVSRGGWATATALLLILFLQLVRTFTKRRAFSTDPANSVARSAPASLPLGKTANRISGIICDADLKDLIADLDGKSNEREKWENVISKKNGGVSYHASCCRPKDGPLKYVSVTIFDQCPSELLRDFYMDSHYRKKWDKTLVEFEQLEADEYSGTEIGRLVKKFPLLTPREYILVWRVWKGNDKIFYCLTKDCEHRLAPQQKKFVRVGFFRSGWRIRKVPGTNACEIAMLHQEDAGLNVEMARLAFSKGIWSYVCKMNSALREYSTHSGAQSPSVAIMNKLIQKVPTFIEDDVGATGSNLSNISSDDPCSSPIIRNTLESAKSKFPSKWIANGLLLIGGVACLSRGRSTLGIQIALACIVKKLLKHGSTSKQPEPVRSSSFHRESRTYRCWSPPLSTSLVTMAATWTTSEAGPSPSENGRSTPPAPAGPPRTGDFLGRHRLSAAISRLEQEIVSLEMDPQHERRKRMT
ncbi:uncharacterized protein LOC110022174 isoform X2 [Phalaenopsis equestris]|uniref:uncharacterized protein LOC110022174 isoform X2 n=1 Tax=Phalaenopsis equestris TaxID=78828 RepID=UPI0009E1FCEC|nr:uncharacterized protein LOC110022174 isoform X2 [Phalaenopsis equestris]